MENNPKEYIQHSGGARGSDIAFEIIGREFGLIDFRHYWHGSKTPHGNVEITEKEFEEGKTKVLLANEKLKRQPYKYMNLLARNWLQVKNSEAVFAIGILKTMKEVDGGTGWAVCFAIDCGKPVYVFDQIKEKWFCYDYSSAKFVSYPYTPILTKNFAGIGTRDINEAGLKAIRDLYKKIFS